MAIFKRRKPQTVWRKVREMCWPSMGWVRTATYYKHRMFRDGDSVHRITAGLAIGASISFTPFLGTHFIQAGFLAVMFRVNWPAALIGTFWGNPWTFPFLFWSSYSIGAFILGHLGYSEMIQLPPEVNFDLLREDTGQFFHYLLESPMKLLIPFALGGYFAALIFWPFAYMALYYPVKSMNMFYHKERLRRTYKRAALAKKQEAPEPIKVTTPVIDTDNEKSETGT